MRAVVALVVVSACGSSPTTEGDGGPDAPPTGDSAVPLVLPPVNAKADYQLGGAYPPASGVGIVSRDRKAGRVADLYNICYVNGFQIQPDEEMYWLDNHPDLILRDGNGDVVRDTQWNEILLDLRLAERRAAVGGVVGQWIKHCSQLGFDAIEIDNLDSYTRSQGLLTQDQAVQTMQYFAATAHAEKRPIAQKNASELVARKADLGTDFAIAEECNRYSECDTYTGGYGDHVIVIEYRQQDFTTGCSAFPMLSIVLRDVNLVTPSETGYVYDGC